MAKLLRSWLDQAGCTVAALRDGFTPEHFGNADPPQRSTIYERLSGEGLTWEFVEAVVDVTTETAALQEGRLAEVRVLWDADCQREVSRRKLVDSDLAHRALDLAEQLRHAEQREAALLAERDRIRELARALMVICDRIRQHVDDLQLAQARGHAGDGDPSLLAWEHRLRESEWQQVVAEMERERVQGMLVEWSRYVADLSRSLLPGGRPDSPQPTIPGRAPRRALDLQDGELADVDRMLGLTGQEVELAGMSSIASPTSSPTATAHGRGSRSRYGWSAGSPLGCPRCRSSEAWRRGSRCTPGSPSRRARTGSGKSTVLEALALATGCRFGNGGLPFDLRSISRGSPKGWRRGGQRRAHRRAAWSRRIPALARELG
ncbi:hypothetical protein ACRAWF_09625 [Streptomyces sp. L7]